MLEQLRGDQSQEGYRKSLENELLGLNRQGAILRGQIPNNLSPLASLQNLAEQRELVVGEMRRIETAREEGSFVFPDGQRLDGIPTDMMNILVFLPTSPLIAIGPVELVVETNARELKEGTTNLFVAQEKTFASMQQLNDGLRTIGWNVATATAEEYGGKEGETETRYYLSKIPEDTENVEQELVVQEFPEIKGEESHNRETPPSPFPTLEMNRQHALERVSAFLQTEEETVLREHQVDVVGKLLEHFTAGKTSGSISLPTGAGKTYVIGELIRILGLPAIVFSNSKEILGQNGETLAKTNPDTAITNFYGEERNISGQVINTLYQSFPALRRRMDAELQRFGLVFYDEADLSLGEERHKIHAEFPNAIKIALTATPYYEQLAGYEERGIINPEDEWVETFRNTIHEMSLEEAFERDIIPKVDITLVRTNTVVPSINTGIDGDFSPSQLARHLNVMSRNALTIGMIGGTDSLPQGVTIAQNTLEELQRIHGKIKGKRTVIHGINVSHILALETILQGVGISARAIHGNMKGDERRDIVEKVKTGEIQIILGDQLTGRGLDIPELEVSIHTAPTLSSRELVQEVGRLFRHSPQTGKTRGIAIQLVDTHLAQKNKQPVLIPSIFAPDFVLRASTRGREVSKTIGKESDRKVSTPAITIEGSIDLDAYFEEIRFQDMVQTRFRNANLTEINDAIVSLYGEIIPQETENISLYDVYSQLAQALPSRTLFEVNQKSLNAIASEDLHEIQKGTQALIALNLKSILTAAEPYITDDTDRNNDLLQQILTTISANATNFHDRYGISMQFHRISQATARSFVAKELGIPIGWVSRGVGKSIVEEVDDTFRKNPYGLDEEMVDYYASLFEEKYNVAAQTIKSYLIDQNGQFVAAKDAETAIDPTSSTVLKGLANAEIMGMLDTLSERERRVIIARFFDGKTLREVGNEFGVTGNRIKQLEEKALRKMRHPSRAKNLR